MASPQQPSRGYSVAISSSNPEASIPQPDRSHITSSPQVFAGPPRFPPTKLQHDHLSPSVKTPTLMSPANAVSSGSPIPHLSTPPGPPVFTSPVRPAAVPFRTSPSTPQPVAFSSGSSLPTSSPPNFSNGSPQLDPQLPQAMVRGIKGGEGICQGERSKWKSEPPWNGGSPFIKNEKSVQFNETDTHSKCETPWF
ncbi:unnamed protein product [Linum trigynum]|uniref:Uncharacterized protein n=1 Tax=Linum trigynum TaxID=586398 RepID=A0AAV2FCS0_9ROSI